MTTILAKLAPETIIEIVDFQLTHDIPNPVGVEVLHSTLLWCREKLPKDVILDESFYLGQPTDLKIFEASARTNCLVLCFTSAGFERRHAALCEQYNVKHYFSEFNPHITFSYDVGDLDPSTLPKFKFPIHIIGEYRGKS